MKIILVVLVVLQLCFYTKVYCQNYCDFKYDYVWIMGGEDIDTISTDEFGGFEINFNTSPFAIVPNPKTVSNYFQNGSMSDKYGNLKFYSNGCDIYNSLDIIMENGENINPGVYHNNHCSNNGFYGGLQNMIILPSSYNDSIYYVVHIGIEYNSLPNPVHFVQSKYLYYTVINIFENNGLGIVLEKNVEIYADTGLMGSPLTAVRHGNGLDWWIITPDRWTNSFNIILLDSMGFHFQGKQYIGTTTNHNAEGGQGKFSPNGEYFAWFHPRNGLFLYAFNRMVGALSDFDHIEVSPRDFITGGCEFSPNSKLLYVNNDTSLYQLDLTAEDKKESLIKIADFDGFGDPLRTAFFIMERTPDKKILLNVLNGSQYLHIIHEPNKRGTSCHFEQHGIFLPTINNFTLPHFPNYRLRAQEDPLCDSLMVSTAPSLEAKEVIYRVVPNPASDHINIEYIGTREDTPVNISISDISGHTVMFTHEQHINTSHLPAGFYILTIMESNKVVQQSKLIISNR